MTIQFDFIARAFPRVLAAVPVTLLISLLPSFLGLFVGLLLALQKIHRIPVLSQFTSVYLSFFKGVPPILLVFLAYYGLPKVINVLFYHSERVFTTSRLSGLAVAIAVFTLYAGAALCEIIRGALNSVNMSQMEAAHALGMTRFDAYRRIIIPQAVVVALPNYFNLILGLIKGTSIVFTIQVMDMMATAKLEADSGYRFIEAYLMVGILYTLASFLFHRLFVTVERRAKRGMGMTA